MLPIKNDISNEKWFEYYITLIIPEIIKIWSE